MCHALSTAGMVPLLFIQKPTFIFYVYIARFISYHLFHGFILSSQCEAGFGSLYITRLIFIFTAIILE